MTNHAKICSFCSFATKEVWNDLKLLLHSLQYTHSNVPLYLIVDDEIEEKVKIFQNNFTIVVKNCLSGKNYSFRELMRVKMDLIEWVLKTEHNTVYVDSDILLLYRLDSYIDFSKDVGLSPHLIRKENSKKYGYYNAGFLFVSHPEFPQWWREAEKTSYFDDQGCLDHVSDTFSIFEFHSSCNFGWWRMFESPKHFLEIQSNFKIINNVIFYEGNPLTSIHTHLYTSKPNFLIYRFNEFMFSLFSKIENDFRYQFYPKNQGFVMIQQYYNDKNELRQKELDECVMKNLQSPFVKQLILWNEDQTRIPNDWNRYSKLKIETGKRWIHYQDVIDYVNIYYKNDIILLANLDIYLEFNFTFYSIMETIQENNDIVFCQSRIEKDSNGTYFLQKGIEFGNCQDAWIFKGNVSIKDCIFPLGYMGCENAFAFEIQKQGKIPCNVGTYCPFIHVDTCRGKNLSNIHTFHNDKKIPNSVQTFLVPNMEILIGKPFVKDKIESYIMLCKDFNKKNKIHN